MKKLFVLLISLAIVTLNLTGQEFIRELDIPVYENDEELRNPWAGGLNYLQYSKIDLNGDDQEDLFIFDRCSNKVLTFRNDAEEAGEINYKYAPEYESQFPSGLKNWVLLRDYNCDGLKDIFTSGSGGIKLFEHSVIGEEMIFTEVYEFLIPAVYNFQTPYEAPVYNIAVDLPHIGDIDEDGDIDILTFSDGSLSVFYYINNASDMGRCDTMAMELANRCYGFFSESSESNAISLEHECSFNVVNPRAYETEFSKTELHTKDGLHTGGTLLSIETNGDGYPELVVGDITNDSLIMLTNSSSVQGPDSMVLQSSDFPASFSDSEKIDFYEFPGAYHEDFNNDGIRDIASSSFSTFNSLDDLSSWLYLNEGTEEFPNFVLSKKEWLQDEMLEHGTNSFPVIFDFNSDGLGDLVIGHRKTITNATESRAGLRLYENIGSLENPEFSLRDENWLEIDQLNLENVYPTFGDLDADGDMDMLLGESTGKVHYFENTAGAGATVELSLTIASIEDAFGEDVDPGQDVIPQLLDIDEDGLLDLIIGEQWGNLNFYKNTGSAEEFQFELIDDEFGAVWVDNILGALGNNTPHFYRDVNNQWRLLTGNEVGSIHRWSNIGGNLTGEFERTDIILGGINDGQYSSPFLYDINGDGFLDLFNGNERGGVTLYLGQFIDEVSEVIVKVPSVNIFPNPSEGIVKIEFKEGEEPNELYVYNILGERVQSITVMKASFELDLSNHSSGLYTLVGLFENGSLKIGKVIRK